MFLVRFQDAQHGTKLHEQKTTRILFISIQFLFLLYVSALNSFRFLQVALTFVQTRTFFDEQNLFPVVPFLGKRGRLLGTTGDPREDLPTRDVIGRPRRSPAVRVTPARWTDELSIVLKNKTLTSPHCEVTINSALLINSVTLLFQRSCSQPSRNISVLGWRYAQSTPRYSDTCIIRKPALVRNILAFCKRIKANVKLLQTTGNAERQSAWTFLLCYEPAFKPVSMPSFICTGTRTKIKMLTNIKAYYTCFRFWNQTWNTSMDRQHDVIT
jgi:hypothetical protein